MAESESVKSLPAPIKWGVDIAKILFVAFSAPVRGMYDVIQNSVLTAATTVCVFLLIIAGGIEYFHGDTWESLVEANTERSLEHARSWKIANDEKDPDSVMGKFSSMVGNFGNNGSEDGVYLKFAPVGDSTHYDVVWVVNRTERGLTRVAALTANADGLLSIFIPESQFVLNGVNVFPREENINSNHDSISFYLTAIRGFRSIRSLRRIYVKVY